MALATLGSLLGIVVPLPTALGSPLDDVHTAVAERGPLCTMSDFPVGGYHEDLVWPAITFAGLRADLSPISAHKSQFYDSETDITWYNGVEFAKCLVPVTVAVDCAESAVPLISVDPVGGTAWFAECIANQVGNQLEP